MSALLDMLLEWWCLLRPLCAERTVNQPNVRPQATTANQERTIRLYGKAESGGALVSCNHEYMPRPSKSVPLARCGVG